MENAPTELHGLIRKGIVSGTLAIEQIRLHGAEKALERIVAGISKAKDAGKTKVTKKHIKADGSNAATDVLLKTARTSAQRKIVDKQAKQLLWVLQSILHDPCFGKLSPGTVESVHRALTGLRDFLNQPSRIVQEIAK
ncbi:hypothetical protein WS67_15855 [Burkholderia singularis]|uniref:Uncharacterized protein n=1 Tax=Burkholderia singularis TaxID=1503053 RepID=A0A118DNE0_9BURK|nr:hypothetical protein WS67_15855 [Burkholderia singularis]